ncbi:MAG: FkbM family methyltransferase [Nitrosopumilus sp.]
MMLDLKKLCEEYKIDVKGVVQVGTHRGQETDEFLTLAPDRILLIEALPHLVKHLIELYKDKSQIKVVHCAISNYNGKANFNVLSNEMSSSLLPLKKHAEVYPDIVKVREIEVPCMRLDSLMEKIGEKFADYNFLDIDVQGAEGLVFEGAMNLLKHIEAINVEVNHDELYEGCILEPDLTALLKCNGFEKKTETNPYHYMWGDAFYVRNLKTVEN